MKKITVLVALEKLYIYIYINLIDVCIPLIIQWKIYLIINKVYKRGSSRGVVANVLKYDIIVVEFKFQ